VNSKKNLIYAGIIVWATLLSILNVSIARRSSDHNVLNPLVDVCDLIHKHYVKEAKDEELIAGAINGMLHNLDPYSEYIPPKEVEEFHKQTSGTYDGIGIGIDVKDGWITVISPFENTPAYQAGVRAGDKIIEVNGQNTKGWSATKAVKELTGKSNTDVAIKVIHLDGSEETIQITRKEIHVPTVRGWRRSSLDGTWDYLLDEGNGIGYVRITQFTGDTDNELDRAVKKLETHKMKTLILDLRSNPGGLMSSAVQVVDRFIDQGVIVSTKGAHSVDHEEKASLTNTYPRLPLIVLIDQGSASGSEIVAGALQDHSRAVIVGKRSWGKGSVQRLIRLPESGAAVKLTTDYYYLPKGRCVHRLPQADAWGVDPDIEEDLDLNKEELADLRELMKKLTVEALTESVKNGHKNNGSRTDEKPTETEEAINKKEQIQKREQAQQLLELDNQLAQAVKQCKGLLRAQPTLPSLAETFTSIPEDQEKPKPDSSSQNKNP
jgi:carboxyl-terminal processing protease